MRVFLDFEASSLSKDSYPIEVGWAGEDGSTEAHLIRPAPDWTDWDAANGTCSKSGNSNKSDCIADGSCSLSTSDRPR